MPRACPVESHVAFVLEVAKSRQRERLNRASPWHLVACISKGSSNHREHSTGQARGILWRAGRRAVATNVNAPRGKPVASVTQGRAVGSNQRERSTGQARGIF